MKNPGQQWAQAGIHDLLPASLSEHHPLQQKSCPPWQDVDG
jgi:hypothetical protein